MIRRSMLHKTVVWQQQSEKDVTMTPMPQMQKPALKPVTENPDFDMFEADETEETTNK